MIVIIVLALGKIRTYAKCVKKSFTRHYQVLHWPMVSLLQQRYRPACSKVCSQAWQGCDSVPQISRYQPPISPILAIFLEKAVFFSKDDFDNTEETLRKFSRFGIFNGWAFFVTGRFSSTYIHSNAKIDNQLLSIWSSTWTFHPSRVVPCVLESPRWNSIWFFLPHGLCCFGLDGNGKNKVKNLIIFIIQSNIFSASTWFPILTGHICSLGACVCF